MPFSVTVFDEPIDPLNPEQSAVPGLDHPVLDDEDTGFRLLSILADDLDLDATEIDLG